MNNFGTATWRITFQSLLLITWHVFKTESSSCGGSITDIGSGILTSPFFPQLYPINTKCSWTITSNFGQGIRLDIEHLDNKEPPTNQCSDTLYIIRERYIDGDYFTDTDTLCASSVAELDATSFVAPAQSSGVTNVHIRFSSDDHTTKRTGFAIAFEILCETNLTSSSGVITSPGFPSLYPANTKCTTHIRVLPGRSVVLTFEEFQLESYPGCLNDYVSVTDGVYEVPLGPLEKYCLDLPEPFISMSNELDLVFHSDEWNNYKGFRASWSTGDTPTTTTARENFTIGVDEVLFIFGAKSPTITTEKMLNVEDKNPEPEEMRVEVYIIAGAAGLVVIAVVCVVVFKIRKRRQKPPKLDHEDVRFQNLLVKERVPPEGGQDEKTVLDTKRHDTETL